jgi:hypothetical protein
MPKLALHFLSLHIRLSSWLADQTAADQAFHRTPSARWRQRLQRLSFTAYVLHGPIPYSVTCTLVIPPTSCTSWHRRLRMQWSASCAAPCSTGLGTNGSFSSAWNSLHGGGVLPLRQALAEHGRECGETCDRNEQPGVVRHPPTLGAFGRLVAG